VSLDLPSEITGVGEQTFQVTVTLRPTDSSRSFASGLIMVGAESDRTYSLGANSVIVTLGGGDQALNGVDAASFTASINVAGLGAGSHDVDVRVVPPGGLTLLGVSPQQVTVFVSEAATPPPASTPVPTPEPSLVTPPPSALEPTPVASVSSAAGESSPSVSAAASASP
jgi:hypothetical protein